MKRIFLAIPLAFIAAGCGGGFEGPQPQDRSFSAVDTLTITARDTIGTEMGEGADVFAFIVAAAYTADGNVAVLDAGKISLQVFSPQGEEIEVVGRKGAGPGEYQMPLGLAVTDYGFVVSDFSGGKLIRYGSDGSLIDEITGFFPVPPVRIAGAHDRFLATDIFMDTGEDDLPSVSMDFAAFRDSSEVELVYESYPMEMSGGMVNSSNGPSFSFASGPGGEAYLALVSDSLFRVTGYDREGRQVLVIEEEWERIPLSEEELAEEEMAISLSIINGETELATSRHQRTDTHRDIVEEIGVDPEGNIWVRMGDTGNTYFRVYSPEGELIHVAVPDQSVTTDGRYSISPFGMLAHDTDPDDWPKVYLLEVR